MKLSIIVPVYNCENALHYCIDSIINQTEKDFELILTDDGSTDSSGKLCDSYAEKYDFIKVIHKKNGGQSSARNMGLEYAKGDYICFVDNDDCLHPKYCEIMLSILEKTKCPIAVCKEKNITSYHSDDLKMDLPPLTYTTENTETFLFEELVQFRKARFIRAFHTKIIKKELFGTDRFNENLRDEEDIPLSLDLCFPHRKAVITEEKLYFYKISRSSVTRNPKNFYRNLRSLLLARQIMTEKLEKENYRYKNSIISNMVLILIKNLRHCNTDNPEFKEIKKDFTEFFDLRKKNFDNLYTKTVYSLFRREKYKTAFFLSGNSFFSIFKRYRQITAKK
ncbi:MAG: glycosyltransferase [Armatimonadetes bacterium]|nr:glycosyltransferase [Candidatus Hippobium faecium]